MCCQLGWQCSPLIYAADAFKKIAKGIPDTAGALASFTTHGVSNHRPWRSQLCCTNSSKSQAKQPSLCCLTSTLRFMRSGDGWVMNCLLTRVLLLHQPPVPPEPCRHGCEFQHLFVVRACLWSLPLEPWDFISSWWSSLTWRKHEEFFSSSTEDEYDLLCEDSNGQRPFGTEERTATTVSLNQKTSLLAPCLSWLAFFFFVK